jgi:tetratricopeptide (TPR) repeat protein
MRILDLQPSSNISSCRKNAFALVILSIILLAIYSNTFHATWHFDDEKILENSSLHLSSFTWDDIKKTLFSQKQKPWKLYRPVACFSLALNYHFSKDKIFSYHVVNLIIHYITAAFLFLFISATLSLPSMEAKYRDRSYSIALLASVFWASNPIQTQAVTYIIQRMASMAGMFYIISMYCYLKGRQTGIHRKKIVFFSLCVIAGMMAMGSKENAFMLPVSIFLFDLLLIQGLTKETLKKNGKPAVFLVFLIICIGMVYYFLIDKDLSIINRYTQRAFTLQERLLTEPRIVLFYLSLIFYPVPMRLSIDHDITISKTLLSPPTTVLPILGIIGILLLAMYLSRRRPFIAFSILFFFVNHLIESSVIPLELVFEHRNYTPSMFLFVPVVIVLLAPIKDQLLKRPVRVALMAFIVCLIIGQGHAAYIRNSLWKTEESLWMAATEVAPALWRPWHNLGRYYSEKNMHKEALAHYATAVTKEVTVDRRDKGLTFYNIGVVYHKMGDKDKALSNYLKAERINPLLSKLHNNKGVLLAEKGYREEAMHEFNEAIRYDRDLHEAYSNLGFLLLQTGRIEEAVQQLETALTARPNNTSTLLRLGYAYRKKELYSKAYLLYKKAQELNPRDARILLYLSEIYLIQGMQAHADRLLDQFIETSQDIDLRVLLEKIIEEGEGFGTIQVDKKVLQRLLAKVYLKKEPLISSIRHYLETNDTIRGEGVMIPEAQ